jgi:lipopolysaccharide biosynthesis protein
MRFYIKSLLIRIMRFFGDGFTSLCARLPKIRNTALTVLYQRKAFAREIPPTGTLLSYDRNKPLSLGKAAPVVGGVILHDGKRDYKGRRVALIAHFDPQGMVDPYVLYYAKSLREAGYDIALCTARELTLDDSVLKVLDAVVARQGRGYDFASWKAAMGALPGIRGASEILLTNDSVFGPIYPMGPVFSAMGGLACDFWGLVESPLGRPHLQSFFIALLAGAVAHEALWEFFGSVGDSDDREVSVGYEKLFTQWLVGKGLTGAARIPVSVYSDPAGSNPFFSTCFQESGQFPFVKRRMLFDNPFACKEDGIPEIMRRGGYPVGLVLDYARRLGKKPCYDLGTD